MAPTKEEGMAAFEAFLKTYRDKYPKACSCIKKNQPQLFTFYDFPAIHWQHIRTTNPIYLKVWNGIQSIAKVEHVKVLFPN